MGAWQVCHVQTSLPSLSSSRATLLPLQRTWPLESGYFSAGNSALYPGFQFTKGVVMGELAGSPSSPCASSLCVWIVRLV